MFCVEQYTKSYEFSQNRRKCRLRICKRNRTVLEFFDGYKAIDAGGQGMHPFEICIRCNLILEDSTYEWNSQLYNNNCKASLFFGCETVILVNALNINALLNILLHGWLNFSN